MGVSLLQRAKFYGRDCLDQRPPVRGKEPYAATVEALPLLAVDAAPSDRECSTRGSSATGNTGGKSIAQTLTTVCRGRQGCGCCAANLLLSPCIHAGALRRSW